MRRSWCCRMAACSLLLLTGLVSANDSGPGPATGVGNKQYNVVVIRANGFEQGTFSFTAETSPDGDADGNETDGNQVDTGTPVNPDTGAGNDPDADTSNPTATGDFGNVGNPNGSGSSPGGMNGTTTGTTTTTSDPPSYWTTARVNGQVASETNDPSSSDYWTTARANGRGGSTSVGGGNGNGDGDTESAVAKGTLVIALDEQSTTGNWYSVDLGGFSLWYATASAADSSTGSMNMVGYATQEIIVGRTTSGSGGMMEAMFNGSFFVGQAAEEISIDE